jgi:hypothetical protein
LQPTVGWLIVPIRAVVAVRVALLVTVILQLVTGGLFQPHIGHTKPPAAAVNNEHAGKETKLRHGSMR